MFDFFIRRRNAVFKREISSFFQSDEAGTINIIIYYQINHISVTFAFLLNNPLQMSSIYLLILYFLFNAWTLGGKTNIIVEKAIMLGPEVRETSGIILLNDRIITHNDSGGGPLLFELDTLTGKVLRTVKVVNAGNHDWEDISQDEKYIYVGDIGNNNGNRKDLAIYRISKKDYLQSENNTVYADKIKFRYSDQTDFIPRRFSSNYDAEALIATEDSLYLFSKNWVNMKTYRYALPKTPGDYSLQIRDSLDVEGLITGAVYDFESHRILLSGYTLSSNFVVSIKKFKDRHKQPLKFKKYFLALNGSHQTEGICLDGHSGFFLSGEKTRTHPATLYKLRLKSLP